MLNDPDLLAPPYSVVAQRIVPNKPGYGHAGRFAVCVVLATGCRAWGFSTGWESAEINAVARARQLEQNNPHKDG